MSTRPKSYLYLYAILFFFSFSNVLMKLASGYAVLSPAFLLLYGASVLILVLYAVVWQQVIKHLPLVIAYANRAVLVVFGMLWGALIFGEQITLNMILGTLVIGAGLLLLVQRDEK